MYALLWFACAVAPTQPSASVDAEPGPRDGWLEARAPDPAPLRIGTTLAEAERSWQVSDRDMGRMRGVGGLISVNPTANGSKGMIVLDDREQVSGITFVYDSDADCGPARERLVRQYGSPGVSEPMEKWIGERYEVAFRAHGGKCTVGWKVRKK
jgi:hypothetical protein